MGNFSNKELGFGYRDLTPNELSDLTDAELMSELTTVRKEIKSAIDNRDRAKSVSPDLGNEYQDIITDLYSYINSIHQEFNKRSLIIPEEINYEKEKNT